MVFTIDPYEAIPINIDGFDSTKIPFNSRRV